MGDIKLNISVKEENNILFKRCIRKLLDSTFIVGDKDEKLYLKGIEPAGHLGLSPHDWI